MSKDPENLGSDARGASRGTSIFSEFVNIVLRKRYVVILGTSIAFASGVMAITMADVKYTAVMVVAPVSTADKSGAMSGISSSLSMLQFGLADDEMLSPFRQYSLLLYSNQMANLIREDTDLLKQLFPTRWDAAQNEWRANSGVFSSLNRWILGLKGVSFDRRPNIDEIKTFLTKNLLVETVDRSAARRMISRNRDASVAQGLLKRVHMEGDRIVRENDEARKKRQVAHISDRLSRSEISDVRNSLANVLAELERSLSLIDGDSAYAAQILDPVHVKAEPYSPTPVRTLILSAMFGFFLSCTVAFITYRPN